MSLIQNNPLFALCFLIKYGISFVTDEVETDTEQKSI